VHRLTIGAQRANLMARVAVLAEAEHAVLPGEAGDLLG
jgi:hypothetical protein